MLSSGCHAHVAVGMNEDAGTPSRLAPPYTPPNRHSGGLMCATEFPKHGMLHGFVAL